MRMTTEEAFVKVLQMHGIEHAFGIIGSAMMPISDLFPKAGITFWDCAHECNAGMMADGFTRATGKMCDGDRPERAGHHQFRHADQDRLLEPFAAAAGHAAGRQQDDRPGRLPGNRADGAVQGHGLLPGGGAGPLPHGRGAEPGDREGLARLGPGADQRSPRLLDAGRSTSSCRRSCGWSVRRAAARRSRKRRGCFPRRAFRSSSTAPAWCSAAPSTRRGGWPSASPRRCAAATSTMMPFRAAIRSRSGPLGYNGSKAAMELIAKADVVLALGTRLNPFSTLPGYGIDYWPREAKIIQVDINSDRIGLTKKVDGRHPGRRQAGGRADPRAAWRPAPARRAGRSARR